MVPAVNTEATLTLGAQLANGHVLRGQNEISHPLPSPVTRPGEEAAGAGGVGGRTYPTPHHAQPAAVCKDRVDPPLPSRVQRILYLATDRHRYIPGERSTGQPSTSTAGGGFSGNHPEDVTVSVGEEVFPMGHPRVLGHVAASDAVVYGMGSLYTSICAALALRGVGEAVAATSCPKILVLNATHDRETTYLDTDGETAYLTAVDVVDAVTDALERTGVFADGRERPHRPPRDYVTHLVVPPESAIRVDVDQLERRFGLAFARGGIRTCGVTKDELGRPRYNAEELVVILGEIVAEGKGG